MVKNYTEPMTLNLIKQAKVSLQVWLQDLQDKLVKHGYNITENGI